MPAFSNYILLKFSISNLIIIILKELQKIFLTIYEHKICMYFI